MAIQVAVAAAVAITQTQRRTDDTRSPLGMRCTSQRPGEQDTPVAALRCQRNKALTAHVWWRMADGCSAC
jgi:hypothetical protein